MADSGGGGLSNLSETQMFHFFLRIKGLEEDIIKSIEKWSNTEFVYRKIDWNKIFELPSKTSKESKF